MNMMPDQARQITNSVVDVSMDDQAVISLEDRLTQMYAQEAFGVQEEQRQVFEKLKQAEVNSDPGELFKLQLRTTEYSLKLSLASALTRKGVGAVETLLRG